MIKPFGNNILFKPHIEEGLAERLTGTGTVTDVGDLVDGIKVGDKIAFLEHGAWSIDIDGEICKFVSEDYNVIKAVYE